MKIGIKCLVFVAMVALVAVQANAQFTSSTFDNAGSFAANTQAFNPPPIGVSFEYGGFTPQISATTAWSNAFDNTGNGGGSVKLSWSFDASDGGESSAFTFYLNTAAQTSQYSNIAFDLLVGPGSTLGTGTNGADYGYFNVFNRDSGYGGFSGIAGGVGVNSPIGQWQHFSSAIPNGTLIRGVTFQWYNDANAGRSITGPEIMYVDNLTLTPVPEPASLALLGLAIPGLMFAARRYRKNA